MGIGATLGVAGVLIGEARQMPGFCSATGFEGTHALDPMLYGSGSLPFSLLVVSLVWGVYGAVALGLPCWLVGTATTRVLGRSKQ